MAKSRYCAVARRRGRNGVCDYAIFRRILEIPNAICARCHPAPIVFGISNPLLPIRDVAPIVCDIANLFVRTRDYTFMCMRNIAKNAEALAIGGGEIPGYSTTNPAMRDKSSSRTTSSPPGSSSRATVHSLVHAPSLRP